MNGNGDGSAMITLTKSGLVVVVVQSKTIYFLGVCEKIYNKFTKQLNESMTLTSIGKVSSLSLVVKVAV